MDETSAISHEEVPDDFLELFEALLETCSTEIHLETVNAAYNNLLNHYNDALDKRRALAHQNTQKYLQFLQDVD